MVREPSFLCTFCWIPQYPPSPPRTMGTESRICCQGCWERILDLAICWVCGEVVVRSDDAVSLGWCFWHRHCFGCLICRNRLKTADVEGAGALELEEIPICGECDEMLMEVGDCKGEVGLILGRANVNRHDGGLSKARWERLNRPKGTENSAAGPMSHGDLVSTLQPLIKATPYLGEALRAGRLHHCRGSGSDNDSFESAHTTVDAHINTGFNAMISLRAEHNGYSVRPRSLASTASLYVSILDPINGPSFQPSSTKPIPRWMRQLPNGVESEQIHTQTTIPSAAVEKGGSMFPVGNRKDVFIPSSIPSSPEEHQQLSQMSFAGPGDFAIPEAILAYNDRRMTMSTPPKMRHQRTPMPLSTGGEMGVKYLKKSHLRALKEPTKGLQESKTGNIELEKIRELGSVSQVADRARSLQMNEIGVYRVETRKDHMRDGNERLRRELNGLFRQGQD